jgi:hypothetical protein
MGALMAVGKGLEMAKDLVEGGKSLMAHGKAMMEALKKGDVMGAMGQLQGGMMDYMQARMASVVPGMEFKSNGANQGTLKQNPMGMLGLGFLSGGGSQPSYGQPPMNMMGMGGGQQQMGFMPQQQQFMPQQQQYMPQQQFMPQQQQFMPQQYGNQNTGGQYANQNWAQDLASANARNNIALQNQYGNQNSGGQYGNQNTGASEFAGQVDQFNNKNSAQDLASSKARDNNQLQNQAAATEEQMRMASQTNAMTQAMTLHDTLLKFVGKAADAAKDNAPK